MPCLEGEPNAAVLSQAQYVVVDICCWRPASHTRLWGRGSEKQALNLAGFSLETSPPGAGSHGLKLVAEFIPGRTVLCAPSRLSIGLRLP